MRTSGTIIPDDDSPEHELPEHPYQVWGVAGEELFEGQRVTYTLKKYADRKWPFVIDIKPLSEPAAPVTPPADASAELDAGAFEESVAPAADAFAAPAREAPIEEAPVPTLLRLDADICLELARELLRTEL